MSWKDDLDQQLHDAEMKARAKGNELKGRAKQKRQDMEQDRQSE